MRKLLVIAIAIVVLVAIVLGIIFLSPKKKASSEATDTVDFSAASAAEFLKGLDDNGTEYVQLQEGSYIIPDQVVLNSETDVHIQVQNDKITKLSTNYALFPTTDYEDGYGTILDDGSVGMDATEGAPEPEPAEPEKEKEHKYSSKEKKAIQNKINDLKKSFETKLGCGELTHYAMTPFVETEGLELPENDLDKVLQGYYQMEYSVRDENGRLWFLWIYSPYNGTIEASLEMIDSPDRYQDFEPIINMQK